MEELREMRDPGASGIGAGQSNRKIEPGQQLSTVRIIHM